MKGPPEKAARACPDPPWDGTTSRNTCERVTWDREWMGDGARERPWPGSRGPSPVIIPRAWSQGQGSLIFCRCRIRKGSGWRLPTHGGRGIELASVHAASELLTDAGGGLGIRYRGIDLLLPPAASSSTRCSRPTSTTVSPASPSSGRLICTPKLISCTVTVWP